MARRTLTALAALSLLGTAFATQASAGWPWPGEVSVAEAYNTSYCDDADTAGLSGLQDLASATELAMQAVWTTAQIASVQFLVFDTASTKSTYLQVLDVAGVSKYELYDPGPWTPDSRGWLPDQGEPVQSLVDLLLANGHDADTPFQFVVGNNVMDAGDTYFLAGDETGEYFLAFNDNGGKLSGDADANEPIILALGPDYDAAADCPAGTNVIIGTQGDDVIYGTHGADCIVGLGGDDTIIGRKGDDVIFGGRGHDTIKGNRGNDELSGGSCHDVVVGGNGDDYVDGGSGDDVVRGRKGHDVVLGGDGDDWAGGGKGNDLVDGGAGNDEVYGKRGNDVVFGGAGDDLVDGDQGHDLVDGGAGDDTVKGDRGNDVVTGGAGDDIVKGNRGDDLVIAGGGDDTAMGGNGDDFIDGGDGTDYLAGGNGDDVCIFGETLHASCETDNHCDGGPAVVARYDLTDAMNLGQSSIPSNGHGLYVTGFFGGGKSLWAFSSAMLDIYEDGSGTLSGMASPFMGGPAGAWEISIDLEPLAGHGWGGPMKQLKGGVQNGVVGSWDYYTVGADSYMAEVNGTGYASLGLYPANGKWPFQLGSMANGMNTNFGLSGWFTFSVTHSNGQTFSNYGDINVNADEVDAPQCDDGSHPFAASGVTGADQGSTNNGGMVSGDRSHADAGLEMEEADVETGFFSLGFGGSAVVSFADPVVNGNGDDLVVWEKTYCCGNYPEETADVFVWDDSAMDWAYVGTASNTTDPASSNNPNYFDLGDVPFTSHVMVVDTTDGGAHSGGADAFDLNGVYGLHTNDRM